MDFQASLNLVTIMATQQIFYPTGMLNPNHSVSDQGRDFVMTYPIRACSIKERSKLQRIWLNRMQAREMHTGGDLTLYEVNDLRESALMAGRFHQTHCTRTHR